MSILNPLDTQKDDGLLLPYSRAWAVEKYRLLFNYANTFATSMKGKWDQRVYIDLFASAGMSRVKETGKIVLSSSLLALNVNDPFDRYVFCEKNPELIAALQERVNHHHPGIDVRYVQGDVNQKVIDVIKEMQQFSRTESVLGFCFVDPFNMGDLKFSTISHLARRKIDFLILIPTGMDAGRNPKHYEKSTNQTVDFFLGFKNWREDWADAYRQNMGFGLFIAKAFCRRMENIGYKHGGLIESVLIRHTEKNFPLYRLGFFSRHPLAKRFWQETKIYSSTQRDLFE